MVGEQVEDIHIEPRHPQSGAGKRSLDYTNTVVSCYMNEDNEEYQAYYNVIKWY